MKKCGQCGIGLKRAKTCYYCGWEIDTEESSNQENITSQIVVAYMLLVLTISVLVSLKLANSVSGVFP